MSWPALCYWQETQINSLDDLAEICKFDFSLKSLCLLRSESIRTITTNLRDADDTPNTEYQGKRVQKRYQHQTGPGPSVSIWGKMHYCPHWCTDHIGIAPISALTFDRRENRHRHTHTGAPWSIIANNMWMWMWIHIIFIHKQTYLYTQFFLSPSYSPILFYFD